MQRLVAQILRPELALGAALFFMLALTVGAAHAESAEEFYRGKTIQILIGADVGGGYDINARLVARHIGKYMPGNPAFLPVNMPGGGSLRAANYVYNVSPHDGTVLGAPSRGIVTMPLMGIDAAKFDMTKFSWIGSVTNEDSVCIALSSTKVKSWDDLLAHKVIVGGSAPGSDTYTNAVMIRNLLGAQFELVSGYPGGKEVQLAMEKGEVDAECGSYSSLKTEQPGWIRDHRVNFLVTIGFTRDPDLPQVPTVMELAKSETQKKIFTIIMAQQRAGRPILAPPGLPPDRLEALRRAFDQTVKDPEFLADAKRIGLEVNPAGGVELQQLMTEIYASPPDIVERAKRAVEKPEDMAKIRKELAAEEAQ
jgi:tripartite-type tricarboxylate transporter receptor subunit TctC